MIVGMIWTVMQAFSLSVPSNLKEVAFQKKVHKYRKAVENVGTQVGKESIHKMSESHAMSTQKLPPGPWPSDMVFICA